MLSWKQAGHRPHPLVLDHSLSFPTCKVWMVQNAAQLEGPDLAVQTWGPGLGPWLLALGTYVLTRGVQGGWGPYMLGCLPKVRRVTHLTLSALGAGRS